MSPKDLISVFTNHGLISENQDEQEAALDLLDEDEDITVNALELLAEFASEKSIWFSLGDCVDEDVIEEFMKNFTKIMEISSSNIKLENLSVNPEVGTKIGGSNINISFSWNFKNYTFSFSKFEPSAFINGFASWAFEVFDGDFLFINEDHPFGYHIPKKLIKELNAIGLESSPF
jgi:hypothetical protein